MSAPVFLDPEHRLYLSPVSRLKLGKHIAPTAFEEGVKTPKFHLRILETLERRSRFTALAIFRGASKSTLITKIYTATEIFIHHEPYVQVVSKDHDKAKAFTKDIKSIFEHMQARGFSVIRGSNWADDYFEVIIDGVHKCIVQAIGAGEDPRGATADFMRPTLIVIDDLESKVGRYPVGNKKARAKLESWFYSDLLPGLHPTRGRVIFLGTIINKDSLLKKCMDDPEWLSLNVPIIVDGKSAWQSRYSIEYILKIRHRYESKGKLSEFYREYMNRAVADEKVVFKPEYFKYFSHVEFEGIPEQREITNAKAKIFINVQRPRYIVFNDGSKLDLASCRIYTTMDVASGSDTGDRSAIVTCAYDDQGNRYFLEIKSGYWDPFQKGVYAIETYLTYKPTFFGIEKGGMQNDFHSSIAVLQAEEGVEIPVEPLEHKGVSKNTRIQNSQPGWIAGRNWLNASDPNTTVLESQMAAFDFESDSDEDDELDAAAYQEKFMDFGVYDDPYDDDDDEDMWS